ncbi:MAG TPA: hypothetical protein VKP67_01450 [Xanthobacteraceae bacterium]|nr:hypothetical protein [Xanthobacteraceae bacterium]
MPIVLTIDSVFRWPRGDQSSPLLCQCINGWSVLRMGTTMAAMRMPSFGSAQNPAILNHGGVD